MPTLTLRDQREQLADGVRDLAGKAAAENRDLTPDEQQQIGADLTKVKAFDDQIRAGEATQELVRQIAQLPDQRKDGGDKLDNSGEARSLGEHFVKSAAYEETLHSKSVTRFTAGTTEFKAPGDPILTTGLNQPQYGPVLQLPVQPPTVADLMSSGTMNGGSLVYYQQGAMVGDFAAVGENGAKPSVDFAFAPVTEPLSKIAGITKISDEFSEDQAALVSVINSQLLLRLSIQEEFQIVSGTGVAPNVRGILNRVGIQVEAATNLADNIEAVYRAITRVHTATQFAATGMVIHPTDYQRLRLAKDLNGQYFGGGAFTGSYGQGGVSITPPVWGLPTIVTTAVPVGAAIVAAWAVGSQLFRRGGVRVESTNSDGDDFRFNRITIRAEERILLACYIPAAFVRVNFSLVP